ncbi:MAG: hypothetical protein DRN12_06525 [Thermoplasmata archaeon]|nr:MAG: hypothetical protein DRN12_06525 [Thermoplasmata archaeon]
MGVFKDVRKEWLLLIPLVILASLLTFYPHQNYPYPLHVDEWFHIAEAKQIALGSNIDWYTGKNFSLGMERAWHLTLALIYLFFKPSIQQWIYLPIILHVTSILLVFYLVYKLYGRIEALVSSLLIALLPSNVTMGGPVFIMPVNLSLIFIPLALIFAFEFISIKKLYNYILLFIVTTFLLYAHPPTAFVLLLILTIYLILQIVSQEEKSKIFYLLAVIVFSILASLPNYLSFLQEEGMGNIKFDFWVYLEGVPLLYGIIPSLFFIVGVYVIAKSKDRRSWTLVLTSFVLLLNILFFMETGLTYILPYQRTFIPFLLIMSIIAGRGYSKLIEVDKPTRKTGFILLIVLLVVTTCISVDRNFHESYYHIIDDEDYRNFLWIKDNTSEDAIIILDPWKARALPAIAERRVYSVMPFGPDEEQLKLVENTYKFFEDSCNNTTFLLENNITVVYTRTPCINPALFEIKENIYILE